MRKWLLRALFIFGGSLIFFLLPITLKIVFLLGFLVFFIWFDYPRLRRHRYVIILSYLILGVYIGLIILGYYQSSLAYADDNIKVVSQQKNEAFKIGVQGKKHRLNTPFSERATSVLGIFALIGIAWLFSTKKKSIQWRPVIWGIVLQIFFGLIVLSPTAGDFFFGVVDGGVKKLLSFSEDGADFVFQSVEPHQIIVGFNPKGESKTFIGHISPPVKTFAFWVLPTIIFFSSLMTILYHLGIMQWVIRFFAWIMQKTMRTSGSETLSAAANIFVGQTEAPLVIKPFVKSMTISELHAVMVGGFATVAGGVMAAYVSFLKDYIPGIAGHLVTASIMSAPAALAISKIMMPETEESFTRGKLKMEVEKPDVNVVEAAARGATEGMTLALNVAAMLIAFVGMVALVNSVLGVIHLSLQQILGWIFAPISWVMGVPWHESSVVGRLLGEKIVLTEFIAYMSLSDIMKNGYEVGGQIFHLSQRSAIIASYALCGFANFASIGIQIGGIGGIAPSRRGDLARIGLRAMIGGAIAACLTGTIVGILI